MLPGLRRPARAPAHARAARTRRTSSRARARPRPAASAASSRCRTPIRSWTRRPCCARSRSAPRTRRSCRSASWPRSRRARRGDELTEMVELAREGAAGFSDDGFPVADARRLRQALQYQRLAGGVLALHEEDPALSGDGVMHEGAVSTMLGLAGIPSISESTMIERDAEIARYEGGPHPHPAPVRRRVGRGGRARTRRGRRDHCRGDAAPPGAHRRGGHARSIPRFKMNPPLRARARPRGADRRPSLGCDRLRRDRPRAALARGEGGAVRAGADGRDRARDGVRRPLHRARAARRARARRCWSSG